MSAEKLVTLAGLTEMSLGWVIWNPRLMVCTISFTWNIIFTKHIDSEILYQYQANLKNSKWLTSDIWCCANSSIISVFLSVSDSFYLKIVWELVFKWENQHLLVELYMCNFYLLLALNNISTSSIIHITFPASGFMKLAISSWYVNWYFLIKNRFISLKKKRLYSNWRFPFTKEVTCSLNITLTICCALPVNFYL